MKKIIVFSIIICNCFWLLGQKNTVDSTIVKFPFSKLKYGWPFESLQIESETSIFQLVSDPKNKSIICIELDKKGCLLSTGIYNLDYSDTTVYRLSKQQPFPPYEKVTISMQALGVTKEGLWIYFSNGIYKSRERYKNGVLEK